MTANTATCHWATHDDLSRGIAHELGHAFALPIAVNAGMKILGTSLLGGGNHTYREELRGEGKGSFLTMASAMRLASARCSAARTRTWAAATAGTLQADPFDQSHTHGSRRRRGALRLEGEVNGHSHLRGDCLFRFRPRRRYRAPTATSVPDAQGQFALEVSDLAQCANGALRVEFCHVNGAIRAQFSFSVTPGDGDLSQWNCGKRSNRWLTQSPGANAAPLRPLCRSLKKARQRICPRQSPASCRHFERRNSRARPTCQPRHAIRSGRCAAVSMEVGCSNRGQRIRQ